MVGSDHCNGGGGFSGGGAQTKNGAKGENGKGGGNEVFTESDLNEGPSEKTWACRRRWLLYTRNWIWKSVF